MDFQELLAPVGGQFDVEEALETWRWLAPQHVTALAVTAFGDLFLVNDAGAVLFLDTIGGKCEEVAASVEEVNQKIQDPALLDEWFMPALVIALHAAGVKLKPGECYSARHSVILGGSYAVENWAPLSWRVHFAIAGQIHEQVKDLPPGTKITNIISPRL